MTSPARRAVAATGPARSAVDPEGGLGMTAAAEHLHTPGENTRDDWKNTILAGLANYIDAGSIVSGAVALGLWGEELNLSTGFLGVLGAFSATAMSAGVGALIGGRLCDLLGRKKIYQWDMLIYAFGMLFLVFAVHPWMIVVGFLIVGLSVGADIPASWTIIAEMAPDGHRGKHSGVAQVLWYMGPTVVLLAGWALSPSACSARGSSSPTWWSSPCCCGPSASA